MTMQSPFVVTAWVRVYSVSAWSKVVQLPMSTAPVQLAAKTLRTFLTAKKDLKLFEFAKAVKADPRRERYYRWFLRIVALGLLARAGYMDERGRQIPLGRMGRAEEFANIACFLVSDQATHIHNTLPPNYR